VDTDQMLAVAHGALEHVTVIKANDAEAAALTGETDPRQAAAALIRLGPRQAVVTVGGEGAILASGGESIHVPTERARVVDATGAGDAVAAVLAAGLTRRGAVTPALVKVAMRVAARVVTERGALAGLPTRDEARAMFSLDVL
jgi:sugar/nucleoside kinase (ribokinase family)